MRRVLPLIRYNYLINHKKPFAEIPTQKPPKYIYQIEYHPTSMPDFDMKFQDHRHANDWYALSLGEQDKYEFQYSGQWWDAMTVGGRLFMLSAMIWMFAAFVDSAYERKEKHYPGVLSFYRVGEISASQLPTVIEY